MSDADALMRKALELTPKGDPVEVAFFMIAARVDELRGAKDGAYEERNKVVALLASLFPSGTAKTEIPGWDPEWHGCVYVDLPTGQASWHYHESQAHLFAHLPEYAGVYDGHTTEEKYERVATCAQDATFSRVWNSKPAVPPHEPEYINLKLTPAGKAALGITD